MRPEAVLAVGQELVEDAATLAGAPVRGVHDDLDGCIPDGERRRGDRAVGLGLLHQDPRGRAVPEGEQARLVERLDAVDVSGPLGQREDAHRARSATSCAPTSAAIARASSSGVSPSGSATRWCTVPFSYRSIALTRCASAISAA